MAGVLGRTESSFMKIIKFQKAKPIWLKGLTTEMNVTAGFRAVFKAGQERHRLRIAGATIYRVWFNGEFLAHGPARCGHGYFRVDEWELPVVAGENLLAIEVTGYNANGYAYLDQPSFVQAEVVVDDRVIAATGNRSFAAYRLRERIQKVQRYSFQRTFVEAYRLNDRSADWFSSRTCRKKSEPVEVLLPKKFVERGVPYPKWEKRQPVALTASGILTPQKNPKLRWGREWKGPRPEFKAFPAGKTTVYPSHELEALRSIIRSRRIQPFLPVEQVSVKENEFKVFDFGTNLTGFIGLRVECKKPVDLYLAFDELAEPTGDVSLVRYHCANVVKYSLAPGQYDLETIEPYTLKFLKVVARGGGCRVSGIYLREYASPEADRARFAAADHRLGELFEAARQTFRQNAVDIFMDCPGRERAGWLCDSFFTARAERDLCGGNPIERNFFENFALPKSYPFLPAGMLPMCYPADHNDGWFIPNWAMWFVIELEEYYRRTGDRPLVERLKPKVDGLLKYFRRFLNADGLLERLEKWVFVEWSEANKFTQDVNYPSNMLYAGMLDAAGRLYGEPRLCRQAAAVRRTIRQQSFDGEFFVDNAVRAADGRLAVTRNRSETCQYYAFFFDVATPATHPQLWQKLVREFGPQRDPKRQYPEIHPSNAFIGFFLRLDVLSRYGEKERVLDQLYRQYLPMAERTGTLWEHKDTSASCNHGFASHVAHILYRDILGVAVDVPGRRVFFDPPKLDLQWCAGSLPVGNDRIDVKWVRAGKRLHSRIFVPQGFTVNSGSRGRD